MICKDLMSMEGKVLNGLEVLTASVEALAADQHKLVEGLVAK